MNEGGRARVRRLVAFSFAFGGDGGADLDLGEGGCEVIHGVGEGGAGVANGYADDLNSSPLFSEGGK